MCGRLNCYCRYSSYSDRVAKKLESDPPEWVHPEKFHPSPNVAPTLHVPVLHVDSGRLVVRSMKWGISPPHVPSLVHNVRLETLSTSKFFQNLLSRQQTCAVLCDGFYEWKGKRPFFFYDNQTGFDESQRAWSEDEWLQKGPPVVALAGVFDVTDYSCSIITREATRTSEIHHRITILLSNKHEILSWLSSEPNVTAKLSQLSRITNETLSYYEVTDRVNSSKYQRNDCHVPKSKAPTSGPLDQWFSRSKGPSEPHSGTTVQENTSNKRKSTTDSATSSAQKRPAGTSKKQSSPAKNGGPLDKWFSKTKKPPK